MNWPAEIAATSFHKAKDALQGKFFPQQRFELVISHCRESMLWLRDMALPNGELVFYEKCGRNIAEEEDLGEWKIRTVDLPDPPGFRKDECVAFLEYLTSHHGNYPDYTIFLQADSGDHMHLSWRCWSQWRAILPFCTSIIRA